MEDGHYFLFFFQIKIVFLSDQNNQHKQTQVVVIVQAIPCECVWNDDLSYVCVNVRMKSSITAMLFGGKLFNA